MTWTDSNFRICLILNVKTATIKKKRRYNQYEKKKTFQIFHFIMNLFNIERIKLILLILINFNFKKW